MTLRRTIAARNRTTPHQLSAPAPTQPRAHALAPGSPGTMSLQSERAWAAAGEGGHARLKRGKGGPAIVHRMHEFISSEAVQIAVCRKPN